MVGAIVVCMSARVVACPSCGTKNRVPVAGKGRAQCASCHTSLPWLVDAGDDDFTAATETVPPGLGINTLWTFLIVVAVLALGQFVFRRLEGRFAQDL